MAHLIHHWTTLAPLAAAAMVTLAVALGEQPWLLAGCGVALVAAVMAAVHHAEVIAHRVGEPLGTLVLGLEPKDIVLLATALLVSVVTLGTGRTSMMQGAVHLVLFATYLFLACVP
jgi:Ca2+:H+ antiporter